jgi:beta-ribofuranosylaminobenzene 5'-phosphate synthase
MRVSVTTGSRLHLGFTNLSEDLGRCFGSIGVALEHPKTVIVVDDQAPPGVAVSDDPTEVATYVRRFSERYSVERGVFVEVREAIPKHTGLGSGTQLALAVGAGMARLLGIEADLDDIALAMCRGRRSGVGVAAFREGGFIVDAGHRTSATGGYAVPTVIWRQELPDDWSFVVAVPDVKRGLSGRSEEEVFAALSPSVRLSEEICRLTQLRLMPALAERDIREFGAALVAIDEKTGLYFSDAQGGTYSAPEVNEIIRAMLDAGAFGAGQSSWGPAAYALVDKTCVRRVAREMRAFLGARGLGGSVFVGPSRKVGARLAVQEDPL